MLKTAMTKKLLLSVPAIIGALLLGSSAAIAAEPQAIVKVSAIEAVSETVSQEAVSSQTMSNEAISSLENLPNVALQVATPAPNSTISNQPVPTQTIAVEAISGQPVSNLEDVPSVGTLDAQSSTAQDLEVTRMDQVTSVSQLSDVQPTDWAFQALQSLVERYGCIAGYPDRTYRGNRATTRYEFAAGLNACLDRVSELIAAGTADLVTKADLATLQRLQEEFAAELATLRGRVDALETRTAELEANQFSATTKLNGLVWFNVTGAGSGGNVRLEADPAQLFPSDLALRGAGRVNGTGAPLVSTITNSPNITLSHLVWLTLNTSFTGKDSLVTQLTAGNGVSPANVYASSGLFNTWGTPFTDQTAGTTNGVSNFVVHDLFYSFPATDNVQVVVGPRVNWYRHFDDNRYTFFLFGASSFNSIGSTLTNTIDRGSGAVVMWKINEQFRLHVGYLGENNEFLPSGFGFNSSSDPRFGLFGGTNTLTAELTFSPSSSINLRFLYNRSNIQAIFGRVGGAIGEPINGFADDGVGGPLSNATADTFSANFDWALSSQFGVFGRYSFSNTDLYKAGGAGRAGSINAQAIQLGVAFPDLGKPGALAVISYTVPFTVTGGRNFLVAGGGDGGRQYEIEASYYYPITDNVALVPSFYLIGEPNNFGSNPAVYVGNLRTQFSF